MLINLLVPEIHKSSYGNKTVYFLTGENNILNVISSVGSAYFAILLVSGAMLDVTLVLASFLNLGDL